MSKTKFTAELEAAGRALYERQAHGMGQMALWQSVPHTVKEEYCRWAADVIRAIRDPGGEVAEAMRLEFNRVQTEKPDWVPSDTMLWQVAIDAILRGASDGRDS